MSDPVIETETVETTVRTMQANVRHIVPELTAARRWPNRRSELVKVLKQVEPSVLGVQECTKEQAGYIEAQLGADKWAFFGTSNIRVFVNVEAWHLLNWWQFPLDAGRLGPTRMLVACHLRKYSTGGTALFCSTHLTHYNNAYGRTWRANQMRQIGAILPTLPDHEKTILMGDINDGSRTGGVRGIAAGFGLRDLRARKPSRLYKAALDTFNGWKDTKSEGVWIDEVFTSGLVKPYLAGVERTDTKRPLKVCASDHNFLRASCSFPTTIAAASVD